MCVQVPSETRFICSPGTQVVGGCEASNVDAGNWVSPLQKQYTLLSTEPSLQPPCLILKHKIASPLLPLCHCDGCMPAVQSSRKRASTEWSWPVTVTFVHSLLCPLLVHKDAGPEDKCVKSFFPFHHRILTQRPVSTLPVRLFLSGLLLKEKFANWRAEPGAWGVA